MEDSRAWGIHASPGLPVSSILGFPSVFLWWSGAPFVKYEANTCQTLFLLFWGVICFGYLGFKIATPHQFKMPFLGRGWKSRTWQRKQTQNGQEVVIPGNRWRQEDRTGRKRSALGAWVQRGGGCEQTLGRTQCGLAQDLAQYWRMHPAPGQTKEVAEAMKKAWRGTSLVWSNFPCFPWNSQNINVFLYFEHKWTVLNWGDCGSYHWTTEPWPTEIDSLW